MTDGQTPSGQPHSVDYKDLFENAPCGYISADRDGRIVRVNATFARWLGFRPVELTGRRISELLSIGARLHYETHLAPVLRLKGTIDEVALDFVCQDRTRLPALVNAAERRNEAGDPLSIRLTVFNASKRRRYERGLMEARATSDRAMEAGQAAAELREQFIAVLGHDLRNPLAALASGIRLLEREPISDRGRTALALMEGSVVRASGLITNVLDFARARLGGGITIEAGDSVPINEIIEQAIAELRSVAPNREIKVNIDVREPVKADHKHWRGIAATVGINWLVKPFSMALLGWLFIGLLFRPLLPADQIESYMAGLILLAAAPCTAMVFVWSNLVKGEPHFTLSQVALNDAIMIVVFAPLVGLLLGLSAITVPWNTLILSVALYIVVPVIVAQLWRRAVLARGGEEALTRTLKALAPVSLTALLATLVLLFGLQGAQIIAQPLVIALLAVPILIQVYFNAGLAYWLNRKLGVAWCVAGPSALIGASNFFELAVATAIALFGFQSGAALATVVGVLVEVPVMLSVVRIVNGSRGWYERGIA